MFLKTIIFTLLISITTQASEWHKQRLQSQNGSIIIISYQLEKKAFNHCYKCYQPTFAKNLYVSIFSRKDIQYNDVSVVMINKSFQQRDLDEYYYNDESTFIQRASYVENKNEHYVKFEDMTVYESGYPGTVKYEQEISVVVDGRWLVDPVTRSHNFKLKLY